VCLPLDCPFHLTMFWCNESISHITETLTSGFLPKKFMS
jgi:hypothetical protein